MIVCTYPCTQTHKHYNFLHWKSETASTKLPLGVDAHFTAVATGPSILSSLKPRTSWPGPHLCCMHLLSASTAPCRCAGFHSVAQPWHEAASFFQPRMGQVMAQQTGNVPFTVKAQLRWMWCLHTVSTNMMVCSEASAVPPSVTCCRGGGLSRCGVWTASHQDRAPLEHVHWSCTCRGRFTPTLLLKRGIYSYMFSVFPLFT